MMNDEDNGGFTYMILLSGLFLTLFFITLIIDYYGVHSLRNTVASEFKNIAVNEININLTDEYSSDYIANFDTPDKDKLISNIKDIFVNEMRNKKNIDITVNTIEINNPSTSTMTCKFSGTFKYAPMLGNKTMVFDMPVEAKAKVIRFDED